MPHFQLCAITTQLSPSVKAKFAITQTLFLLFQAKGMEDEVYMNECCTLVKALLDFHFTEAFEVSFMALKFT